MLSKSEAISLLSKDFPKNVCLIEVLKRDKNAKILYAEDSGVMLKNCDGIYLVSLNDYLVRDKVISLIDGAKVAMCTDERTASVINEKFHIGVFKKCYQAFWNKREKIPENPEISIDKMLATDYNIKAVLENYRFPMTKEEVFTAIQDRGMFSALVDGNLAGFIGFHSELSMGMLEVFPPYRRMGLGSELLIRDINYCLDLGGVPFCHIVDGNDKSRNMCLKVGLTFYNDYVYWVG